eukprot:TRINITY_DN2852_c0_g1_i6.p1 TRINITY_DN2852_c0_g1~~TRINITY_DN2852_c0_g1_i6.p1  ORF type:complete len:198 (-),score=37.71 TRINITY_DN2852_c0_g1_i6:493-1086(-)
MSSKFNEWVRVQEQLKTQLIERDVHDWVLSPHARNRIARIGGVDISFVKGSSEDACASLVVLSYPELEVLYQKYEMVKLKEEYIPGFLAFREVEHLQKLCVDLQSESPELYPQVIFVDGNGVLHPRGLGLASHLGVLVDTPTIGVGKTFFNMDGLFERDVIMHAKRVLASAGSRFPLVGESGKVHGMVLVPDVSATT